MKTLGKLQINPKKLLKNEELQTLRGGYTMCFYECSCSGSYNPPYSGHIGFACTDDCVQAAIDILNERCVGGEGTCNQTNCI